MAEWYKFLIDRIHYPWRSTLPLLTLTTSRLPAFDPAYEMSAGIPRYVFQVPCQALLTDALQQPIMMSAGWLGGGWGTNESSVIARHEWKGLSKMRYSLEDYVEQQNLENAQRAQRAPRRGATRAMPGTFRIETDEDE